MILTLLLVTRFQHLMSFIAEQSSVKAILLLHHAYLHSVPFCLFTIYNNLLPLSSEPNFGSKGESFHLVATVLLLFLS